MNNWFTKRDGNAPLYKTCYHVLNKKDELETIAMDTFEDLYNIITLKDKNRNDTSFEFLDVIEYEDEEYVVLLPTGVTDVSSTKS